MSKKDRYRIAAAAALSQLPVATIRIWERRYGAVTPSRESNGTRLYNRADIERLTLLGGLVARGHAIGTIARLDDHELRQRAHHDRAPANTSRPRVLLVGAALAARTGGAFAAAKMFDALPPATTLAAIDHAPGTLDFIVAEIESLHADSIAPLLRTCERLRPRLLIVQYGEAGAATLRQLQRSDLLLVRGPSEAEQLVQLCGLAAAAPPMAMPARAVTPLLQQALPREPAERRYTRAQLDDMETHISALRCECPRHLAELVTQLAAFEQYSRDCRNASPRDAGVHEMLRLASGHARALIEDALQLTLEAERAPASGRRPT